MAFWFSVYYGVPIALGIADRPLSADLVVESLKYVDVEAAVLPPAILEDMSLSDEAMKALAKLFAVAFGGGSYPLSSVRMDMLTNDALQGTWFKRRATGSSMRERA